MPVRRSCPGLRVTGVDVHIGSQITDLDPMESAFRLLADFVTVLRGDGHTISHVDFGGGLGIPYYEDPTAPPEPVAYAAMVKRITHNLGCRLMFEPGRMIVGNAGILVARVIHVKHGDGKTFVIIDAAMNDLIRPTLYEAYHDILPIQAPAPGAGQIVADVVGPVCETGDYLALSRQLAGIESRRSDRDHERRRLWRGTGLHLQHPSSGARSAGEGRSVRGDPPARQRRATDRDGPAGTVAVSA